MSIEKLGLFFDVKGTIISNRNSLRTSIKYRIDNKEIKERKLDKMRGVV